MYIPLVSEHVVAAQKAMIPFAFTNRLLANRTVEEAWLRGRLRRVDEVQPLV